MTLSSFLKGTIVGTVWFFIADIVWHGFIFNDFYMSRMTAMGGNEGPNLLIIVVVDIIAAAGFTYFLVRGSKTIKQAAIDGAILGGMIGLTLNLVNHTLLPAWDATLVVVDSIYVILACAVMGALIFWAAGKKR